jgi:hypothetical protein
LHCDPTLPSGVPPWLADDGSIDVPLADDGSIDVPLDECEPVIEPEAHTLRMPPRVSSFGGEAAFWRGAKQTFYTFVIFVVLAYAAGSLLVR